MMLNINVIILENKKVKIKVLKKEYSWMDGEETLNYKSLCLSVFPSSTGRQLRQTAAPPSDPRNKRHFTENIRATNKRNIN